MTAYALDVGSVAAQLRPLAVARLLSLPAAPGARSDRCVISCPWHEEKHPSCVLVWKDGRTAAYCQSCRTGGDVFELYAAVHGLHPKRDFRRIAREVADLAGIQLGEERAKPLARRIVDDPIIDLAVVLDEESDRWLRGLDPRKANTAAIQAASPEQVLRAYAMLADDDAREQAALADFLSDSDRVDAEMDRLADAYEARA